MGNYCGIWIKFAPMKAFDKFRIKAGEYYLKKAMKTNLEKRKPLFTTFDAAMTVGILARVEDEQKLLLLKGYIKQLKEEHGIRKVVLLGYHDKKELSKGLQQPLDVYILSRKNLNWYARPMGIDYKNFVHQEFDMLLDLTRIDCVPLNFAIAESKARFKIGLYKEHKKALYDFMIILKNEDIHELFKEINKYLSSKNQAPVV